MLAMQALHGLMQRGSSGVIVTLASASVCLTAHAALWLQLVEHLLKLPAPQSARSADATGLD